MFIPLFQTCVSIVMYIASYIKECRERECRHIINTLENALAVSTMYS